MDESPSSNDATPSESGSRTAALPTWKRLLRSMLTILVLVYLGSMIVAVFFGDRLLFQPPPRGGYREGQGIRLIRGADGKAVAILDLVRADAPATLLFSHGNAEDLGTLRPLLDDLHRQGLSILAYDYPGYGLSDGTPSESGAVAAHEAAFDELTRSLKIPAGRVILHGRSLGAGVATEKAARGDAAIGGLILESPFLSAYRVLAPVPLFPADRFPNLNRIGRVTCPLLIIHGEDDSLIPIRHGRTLLDLAKNARSRDSLWVRGAGHNDIADVAGRRYAEAIREFATHRQE